MIPQLTVYTKILYLLMVVIAGSLCSREQVHLYSKCANRFVGIHEGKVVANDDPVTSQTISISDQISKGIIFAPLKLTLFIEEVKMYLCFNKRWRLVPSKKLHEYCYFSEHMEEGYHRFKSVTDDTKHIGFTATGRQMAFRNRTIHNENCYSFTKITPKQLKASKAAAAETTATVSSTAFAKPKVAHTSLNGMSTGETQHRHHQNHHLHRQQQPQQRHKQHHQHQQQQQQHKKQPHQSHHKSARKTPSIPKLQSYNNNNRNATNRNLINNNRVASSNLSTLTPRTNSKNINNNNNNSSNRSSFRDISSSNTSVTTSDGLASSNSNGYNISDRYGNRSSISERISNSSIISSVNRTNKNKTQINLSHKHHLRHRHSQTKPQTKHQLPFHVQSQQQSSSSSTVKNFHNFQSDQSEQQRQQQQQQQHPQQQHKPDIFEQEQEQEQRNRNERKVVSFHDNIDSVRRSHINHRSPHNSHSFHYLQKNVDLVVPNETAAAVANDRQRLTMAASSAAKPSALDVPHKKDFRTKKKSHLDKHSLVGGTPPKLNDPYLHHRHRHHHGDHQPPKTIDQQSLTLPHYLDKMASTKKTKRIHHHQQQHHNRPQEEDIV
ncbi:myb-like protein Q isoform X1 [Sitodiplosis mosellana]|uniref:myb-like protein Q isoform X1 n=2 Tax=Sitodiplosis mosellana TaxID=263140 RepID=UPI0024445E03|nr:myb-like protein Q isoform X1 [Sitodiplosis mosellana]